MLKVAPDGLDARSVPMLPPFLAVLQIRD